MNQVPAPESDFDMWGAIFQGALEPFSRQGYEMLKQLTRLLNHIFENDQLPAADRTSDLLHNLLPSVVLAITNLARVSVNSEWDVQEFLTATARTAFWAALKDDFETCDNLLPISDQDAILYQPTIAFNYRTFWRFVCNTSLAECNTLPLISRIRSGPVQPEHFSVLFRLFSRFKAGATALSDFTSFSEPISLFVDFLGTDQTTAVKWDKLSRAVDDFLPVLGSHRINYNKPIDSLFEFAENSLKSDNLEKQITGATLLSYFVGHSVPDEQDKSFQRWKSQTDLGKYLFSRDLHNQLLEACSNLLEALITQDTFPAFWARAEQSYSSQRRRMLDIAARSMNAFGRDFTDQFVNSLLARDSLTPEVVEFIASTAASCPRGRIDFAESLAEKLIEMACAGRNVEATVSSLAKIPASSAFHAKVCQSSKERLVNPEHQSFAVSLLQKLKSHA
jgi:hypothetical protein